MSKPRTKLYAAKADYLSPEHCDSFIGYSITSRRRLNAIVELADCERRIKWYFEHDDTAAALRKVDRAIEILREFRENLVLAQKAFLRRKRTRRTTRRRNRR